MSSSVPISKIAAASGHVNRRTFVASCGGVAAGCLGEKAWCAPNDPLASIAADRSPPKTWPATSVAAFKLDQKAIYFEGTRFKGRPTKVFAIVGKPENIQGQVPAVVLAHGGGGTAYAEWVKLWTDAGFIAIAPALEGQSDVIQENVNTGNVWERNPNGGPARDGIYCDWDAPLEDQWMFHAQWAVASAHLLLAAMSEVDPLRIGLCGISWGGVITATAIGLNPRIAFAIPIYGCGFLSEMDNQYSVTFANQTYMNIWEPGLRLGRAAMPTLWMTDLHDSHFSLVQQAKSYRLVRGAHMVSVFPEMIHGHSTAWTPRDSYIFARSVAYSGGPWAQQITAGQEEGKAWAAFQSIRQIKSAQLFMTTDRGHTRDRKWILSNAEVTTSGDLSRLTASLVANCTAWVFVADADGATLSNNLMMIGPQ